MQLNPGFILSFFLVLTAPALPAPSVLEASSLPQASETPARVPALELMDLEGISHSFDPALPENAPCLFLFFEPRSGAALMELKFLAKLHPMLREKGLDIAAVEASGLDRDELSERRRRLFPDLPFPIVPDPGYGISRLFGPRDVPSTYLVGGDGAILGNLEGFTRGSGAELTKMVVASLSAVPAAGKMPAPAAVLATVYNSGDFPGETEPAMLAAGDQAAPFESVDLAGNRLDAGWSDGDSKVHVVFFWGAMCLPCMREMTYLEEIYKRTRERGLRIIAVQATAMSVERTAAVMKRYERVYPAPTFPIVADTDGSIRRTFGVKEGGPATFFIDRGGTVTFAIDDFALGYEDTMATKIERALQLGSETIDLTPNADGGRSSAAAQAAAASPLEHMYEENLALGEGYYSTGSYERALNYYLKALSIEPADVYLLCRVADIYERKGNLSAARRAWKKVLGYDAGNVEALRRLNELKGRSPVSPSG